MFMNYVSENLENNMFAGGKFHAGEIAKLGAAEVLSDCAYVVALQALKVVPIPEPFKKGIGLVAWGVGSGVLAATAYTATKAGCYEYLTNVGEIISDCKATFSALKRNKKTEQNVETATAEENM